MSRSLPIALLGYAMLPDVPEISDPWFLTKEVNQTLLQLWGRYILISQQEVALARKRMELEGRKNRAPYTKAKFVKIFSSWHIYLLSILYMSVAREPQFFGLDPNVDAIVALSTMPVLPLNQSSSS